MAIINHGIWGTTHGRIGPVTGYQRNGQNILRTARNRGVVKDTTARLAQREKIKICNEFTRAFTGTGFFNKTFPAYGHTGSGYNRVTSCLMNLAISGDYPGQKLAWEKVLVARGPLPIAESAVAIAAGEEGIINFSWMDNSGTGTARGSDKAILVAYSPETMEAVFSLAAGTRDMTRASLNAASLKYSNVATWMAFINKNGDVCNSVYCGMVEV